MDQSIGYRTYYGIQRNSRRVAYEEGEERRTFGLSEVLASQKLACWLPPHSQMQTGKGSQEKMRASKNDHKSPDQWREGEVQPRLVCGLLKQGLLMSLYMLPMAYSQEVDY